MPIEITKLSGHRSRTALVATLASAQLLTPLVASAQPTAEELCAAASHLALGATVDTESGAVGEPDCYRLELPSAGVLMLDAAVLSSSADPLVPLRLGLPVCAGQARVGVAFRTAAHLVLSAREAAEVTVCVGPQDPLQSLGLYRLASRFAAFDTSLPGLKTENEGEIEAEPDGRQPGRGNGAEDPLMALCRRAEGDDHGEVPECATRLVVGGRAVGLLAGPRPSDHDLFTFDLTAERTVRILVHGTAAASLEDERGERLARLPAAPGGRSRLVKTLQPGRFYLRLQEVGPGRLESGRPAYSLELDSVDRSW